MSSDNHTDTSSSPASSLSSLRLEDSEAEEDSSLLSTNSVEKASFSSTEPSDEDESSSTSAPPPDYSSVLLEELASISARHPSLFPTELDAAVSRFLLSDGPALPDPDPYRTDHSIERDFPEGRGCYVGELDHKGRRSGRGGIRYSDTGDRYQGCWHRGYRDGDGAHFWAATGSVFAGKWRRGERRGRGHFVYGSRRTSDRQMLVLSGIWDKGRLVAEGEARAVVEDRVERMKVAVAPPEKSRLKDAFRKMWEKK